MKRTLIWICMCFAFIATHAQVSDSIRVLFIGNSYTYTNNLPQMLADCAASTGKHIEFASSTPGGYTFSGHLTNTTTLGLIQQGNWDFVVLQEQSQIPSFPQEQVATDCYPYAAQLNDSIEKYNPCAETVFYMTWGRKNGDAQNCAGWPPVCTYEGMDDLLRESYLNMAQNNDAIVAPAGPVWRNLRSNFPDIDLYNADGSHPSLTGTYAITMAFYAALFRADPSLLSFSAGLDSGVEQNIRSAAKNVVFDSLQTPWLIGSYDALMADCFDEPSSVNTLSNNFVNVYTKGSLICVDLIHSQSNFLFEIHDLMGKTIYSEKATPGFKTFDTSAISNGTYIVTITQNGILSSSKVIISN